MLSVKVCEACVAARRSKAGSLYGWEGSYDLVMLPGTVKCRSKWLSASRSKPPAWCGFKLEHAVSREPKRGEA
jgi:hypothetical protein